MKIGFQTGMRLVALALAIPTLLGMSREERSQPGRLVHGTGLVPVYPEGYDCSPLTSLYASMIDVDGSERDEPHSGVDGGRYGDNILAPAGGVVLAVWRADWGWGDEGALLIKHSSEDLNFKQKGGPWYYSEFDHLDYDDISDFETGDVIVRGQQLAQVSRPGGRKRYLPEVHWEVWQVSDENDRLLEWKLNKQGMPFWLNSAADLIDPLSLFKGTGLSPEGTVEIRPNTRKERAKNPEGFNYILPCRKRK